MDQIAQTIIIGIANGMIFALVALGYTLVYGIIELINFAHGEVFMLGSFVALVLITTVFKITAGTPLALMVVQVLLVIAITMLATATLNVSIERVAYRPLRNAPKLAPLISAIGMSFVLQNVALLIFGPANDGVDRILPNINVLSIFGIANVTISAEQVFVALVTIPLLLALSWFVTKTRQGKAMRATAQDPDTAGLMGVDVNRTIAITFLIGGALAGAAGVFQGQYLGFVRFDLGFNAGLKAFTAAVLGGIGNLTGAALGGFLIAFLEVFAAANGQQRWSQAIVFVVLIVVLVFRPAGILGQQIGERA